MPTSQKHDLTPRDVESEKVILGALLLEPDDQSSELFDRLAGTLTLDDFSLQRHKHIWSAMFAQHEAKLPIGRVHVAGWLRDHDKLDLIGGLDYLCSLGGEGQVGTILGLDPLVTRLREKSNLRQAIDGLSKLINELSLYGDTSDAMVRAEELIERLGKRAIGPTGFKSVEEIIAGESGLRTMQEFLTNPAPAIPTPFASLNRMLGGGLRGGDYAILAARPSMGKTAVAMQIARCAAIARPDAPPVVFSYEMGNEALFVRMLCAETESDSNLVRQGLFDRDLQRRLIIAASTINEYGIAFNDDTSGNTIAAMKANLRRRIATHPVGMVIVDYVQLMEVPGRTENRNQELSYVSRKLKGMARDMNIPFVVLSQLKRPLTKGDVSDWESHPPDMADLRETGSFEQDADIITFLYGDPQNLEARYRNMRLRLSKQRNGPVGTISCTFDRITATLHETTLDTPPPGSYYEKSGDDED